MALHIICLFVILIPIKICYPQTITSSGVQVHLDSSKRIVCGHEVNYLIYEITNRSNETNFLIFGVDRFKGVLDSIKIRKYFYRYEKNWDFTFLDICTDYNISKFTPNLFETFLKEIKPAAHLTFLIIVEGSVSADKRRRYFNFIKNNILMIEENRFYRILPVLKSMNRIVLYQPKIVSILEKEIVEHQKEISTLKKSEKAK